MASKTIIFSASALIASIFAAYAFSVTPEYKVSSVLRPAAINELDALNRSEVYVLPPGEALVRVGMALESYEIRMEFLDPIKSSSRDLCDLDVIFSRRLKSSIKIYKFDVV